MEENLGINIKIEVVDSRRAPRASAKRLRPFPGGWNQDYPDPENWILGSSTPAGAEPLQRSDPKIDSLFTKAKFNTEQ